VGVELVTKPSLVFLDEPTSGLDSDSAENCVRLLRTIAKRGTTVACTIHQPSSEVLLLFLFFLASFRNFTSSFSFG
jgi:ABC-type multidrug transport system ATPase subunit